MGSSKASYAIGFALALAAALIGCAGGPTREQVLRSEREYDLARGLFGERDFAGAFEHLLEAIELDPDNAEAHLLLANLYFLQRRDFEQAELHFQEALRAAERGDARAGLPSDTRNSMGVMYIHMERYDAAEEVLRASSSDLMNRDPALSKTNLAWALLEMDRPREAVEVLLSAVQQSPQLCIGFYRLGQARVALDQYEEADEALSRGLEVENEDCQRLQAAWRLRGETRARLGHREDAIADLERCVELASESEDGQACQRLLDTTSSSGATSSSEDAPADSPDTSPEEPAEAP